MNERKINPYDLRNPGKRDGEIRQDGYEGENRWFVACRGRAALVYARDRAAAIWTAAKHWGMNMRGIGNEDFVCRKV